MKLYEISKAYFDFMEAINDGDIPLEAIADTLEGIEGSFDEKIENTALVYKNQQAMALALKAEEKTLADRRKSLENGAERLKEYMSDNMLKLDKKKLETSRVALSFRKSESIEILDETLIPDDYFKIKREVSKTDIKTAIKSGMEISGAILQINQNLQIK